MPAPTRQHMASPQGPGCAPSSWASGNHTFGKSVALLSLSASIPRASLGGPWVERHLRECPLGGGQPILTILELRPLVTLVL